MFTCCALTLDGADLGTWGSLYEMGIKDEQRNAILKTSKVMMYESLRKPYSS